MDSEDAARSAKRSRPDRPQGAPPPAISVPPLADPPPPPQRSGSRKSGNSNSSTPTAAAAAAMAAAAAATTAAPPVISRTCVECGATQTPQWREGPQGEMEREHVPLGGTGGRARRAAAAQGAKRDVSIAWW